MGKGGFESLHVYQLSEKLSDLIWKTVEGWSSMARDTVGKQIVRAADSIGANIAEGCGRGTYRDNRRFVDNARGSLYETRHWLRRAFVRNLLPQQQVARIRELTNELGPRLNAYRNSLKRRAAAANNQ